MSLLCIASHGERRRSLPADPLVPDPLAACTHAITIRTGARCIWPWIVQMGAGRAGWYAYDFIDNGGRRSAELILPHLQELRPGDLMPALPGARTAFTVARMEVYRELVLTASDDAGRLLMTRELWLEPIPAGGTRLLARTRLARSWLRQLADGGRPDAPAILARFPALPRLPRPLLVAASVAGYRLAEARMLRGIRRRAERGLQPVRVVAPARPRLMERLLPRAAVAERSRTSEPVGAAPTRGSGHPPTARRRLAS